MNITTPEEDEDPREYVVVINEEEQYSIWPTYQDIPSGWTATTFKGSRNACLRHIEEVWTDMRPRSLRLLMEDGEKDS